MKKNEPREKLPLKTIDDIGQAHEWLFNKQVNKEIDNKTADSMNTTLKGVVYLKGKLRLDAAKLLLQAQIKKAEIPDGLLPDLTG